MFLAIYHDRNPGVLALFHAEAGFKIDLVVEIILLDKLLKGLDNVVGPFDMAGTADADT
jgi:hypothetical protein